MNSKRKVILYIAASLDGYIAKPGDDLSFLSAVEMEGEDYGYKAFMDTIDTVIMGRRTYDWVMARVTEFPHPDIESYIVTRTTRPSHGKLHFYTGEPGRLIRDLTGREGKNIFIDGGAELVHALLLDKLIDEMIISIAPVLLGDGIRLFRDHRPEQELVLVDSKSFSSGLVQLHYKVENES